MTNSLELWSKKGQKYRKQENYKRANQAPNPHIRVPIFGTDKEPLAQQFSGPESACSSTDF